MGRPIARAVCSTSVLSLVPSITGWTLAVSTCEVRGKGRSRCSAMDARRRMRGVQDRRKSVVETAMSPAVNDCLSMIGRSW